MIFNVKKFNSLLRKATINYSIGTFYCDITKDKITSRMIKPSKDAIVVLEMKNDVFVLDNDETITFNFSEPNVQIVPYLNLIDSEEAELIVRNEKLILKNGKQKSNLFFCDSLIPSKFGASEPKGVVKPFLSIDMDDEFKSNLSKIKKVGNKFGKVYFTLSDKKFLMETTDKTNKFSNGLSFDIAEIDVSDKFSICFDFSNVSNMFAVLTDEESYKLEFTYIKEKEMGLLSCIRDDNEERYYLVSKMEI